jgi:putative FmdB family regulatory protein
MPIYEYVCDSCRKKTEVIQAMNAPRLRVCPHCGGKLKKAFSAPAIQFKGSGFYITDYSRGNRDEGGTSKKGAKSDEGSGGEKADAKADAGEKKTEKKEKSEKSEKKKQTSDT